MYKLNKSYCMHECDFIPVKAAVATGNTSSCSWMTIWMTTPNTDSKSEEDNVAMHCGFAFTMAILSYALQFIKIPVHMSALSGQQWQDELLAGHDR
jgi:hypothetical protein